jgi:stage V sporulation protein S
MEILFSNIGGVEPKKEARPESGEAGYPAEGSRPAGSRPSVLKVSARSRPSAVAGAIAGVIRETGRAELQSIGAGATNQAVKAIAIARSYLQEDGIDIVCIPSFAEVTIEQEERTAMRLVVERRN